VAIDGDGNASNMNVETLRRLKLLFDQAEVPEEIPRHIALTGAQLYSMLGQTEATSSDFASVKALVQGQMDAFMGFQFHRLELVNSQASALSANFDTGAVGSGSDDVNGFRKVIAWAQDGMVLGVGKDLTARIAERTDKCFSVQTYGAMSVGAVRMEEVKVAVAFCDETIS
jgi:hypothetical protein